MPPASEALLRLPTSLPRLHIPGTFAGAPARLQKLEGRQSPPAGRQTSPQAAGLAPLTPVRLACVRPDAGPAAPSDACGSVGGHWHRFPQRECAAVHSAPVLP